MQYAGVALSFAGAALDFTSGSLISVSQSGLDMMHTETTSGLVWTIVLYSLGALLALTGILSLTSLGMKRMQTFGGFMVAYGVVMLGLGGLMFSIQLMQSPILLGGGMLIVGALMILNASVMLRGRTRLETS